MRREAPCNWTWSDPLDQVTVTVIIIYIIVRITINVLFQLMCHHHGFVSSPFTTVNIFAFTDDDFFTEITEASGNKSDVLSFIIL